MEFRFVASALDPVHDLRHETALERTHARLGIVWTGRIEIPQESGGEDVAQTAAQRHLPKLPSFADNQGGVLLDARPYEARNIRRTMLGQSLSSITRTSKGRSASAWRNPASSATPLPRFFALDRTRTRPPLSAARRRRTAPVPSVEPSSTAIMWLAYSTASRTTAPQSEATL